MATKKTAAKEAPAKKAKPQPTGTEMAQWDAELAEMAKAGSAVAGSTGSGSKGIKTRGGRFNIDGDDAGTEMDVIILEGVLENAYYGEEGFDPDNPKMPEAFAIGAPGQKAEELVWHEDSIEPYAGTLCKDSDINQWGSAEKGRGKACKNINRMMLIAADDLDEIATAEARVLKAPVTSVKNWAGYVKQIDSILSKPTLAVKTRIKLVPHPKHQFEMKFEMLEEVPREYIGELIAKRKATLDDLMRPYTPMTEEEEAPAKAGKGAGKALAKGVQGRSQPVAKVAGRGRR